MRLIAVWALVVALVACQPGQPQAQRSPAPRHSGTPTGTPDPQRCARLAKRGLSRCPPTADQLRLPPTTAKNATNGAVDDDTARRWVSAFQLAQAYYYWAMEQNARDALTSGVLADTSATENLFGPDLRDLDRAKQEGGILIIHFYKMPTTQVVVIPVELQQSMSRQGLTPKPFGLATRFQGPASRAIRFPDGHETRLAAVDSNDIVDTLAWGDLKADSDLGNIWYGYGYYGCDGSVKSVCKL